MPRINFAEAERLIWSRPAAQLCVIYRGRIVTDLYFNGELDRLLKLPVRWATGFQLGGERGALGGSGAMGTMSSERTFGHNGSYACLAWADPKRRLVMAYLTNLLVTRAAGTRHMAAVSDAVRRACVRDSTGR